MKPDIYQVELIGSGSLSVMAKPVSGEWIEDEFESIRNSGINRIVSLLERHEEFDLGLRDEQLLAEKYNMDFVSYPIPDRKVPNSIDNYLGFTERLYREATGGLHTVIHCRAGIGRAGLVAAGVLLYCGFEPTNAFEHISEKRGVKVPDTQEQIDWVEKCYKTMSA